MVFFRSAPAQNALPPAPVTIATQMSGLSRISTQASCSAEMVSGSSAFIASGRLMVTVATRSSTSNRTVPGMQASVGMWVLGEGYTSGPGT